MQPTPPWWGPAPALPQTSLPATTDIVVIGGGVMGLATAYRLARAGLKPLLLEATGAGAGATGRNGGFVALGTTESYPATIARLGHAAARDQLRITLENRQIVESLIAEEAIDCEFRPAGHLHLSLSEQESAELKLGATRLSGDGCASEWLERDAVTREIGTAIGAPIAGGVLTLGSALLHSGKLIRGLAQAVVRRGGAIARAQVQHLEPAGRQTRIVTDCGNVISGRTLMAVNAWTGRLVSRFRDAILPVRGQMLAYGPVAPVFPRGMTAMWTATEEYWQQTADGSILIGGCRAAAAGRDEGVESLDPSAEVQAELEKVLPSLFPSIGPLRVTHRWAGPMAFTRDRLPLIGPISELPGVWVAGGFSGHGMAMAFSLSGLVAQALITGKPDSRLEHFSPERFAGAEP